MQFLIQIGQLAVAMAVTCGAIYFQQSTGYDINPYIIGAWGFMAAYGVTWLVITLLDRRVRYGRILPRFQRKNRAD